MQSSFSCALNLFHFEVKVFLSCLQQTLSRFEFGPIRRRVDEGVAFFRKHQIERAELEEKGVVEPKKSPRVCGIYSFVILNYVESNLKHCFFHM
jgi:hypothetical protein